MNTPGSVGQAAVNRPRSMPQSAPLVRVDSMAAKPKTLILGLATGLLLWLCYFPADCGWLAWIALVPFLCLVRSKARPRRAYLAAWLAGLAFLVPALQWMRVADAKMYLTWIALALYCSLYFPAALFLLRRFDRRWPISLAVSLPVIWTALEFLRAHFFLGGFPWYFLAHAQHRFLAVIQVSDLAGAYAVSALVAAVNGVVFEILFSKEWFRSLLQLEEPILPPTRRAWMVPMSVVAGLFVLNLGYGFWRLRQGDFESGPRVALLQGNIPQAIRNEVTSPTAAEDAVRTMARHFNKLCDDAVRLRPDLVIWPETSFVYGWHEVSYRVKPNFVPEAHARADAFRQQLILDVSRRWPVNHLLGVNVYAFEEDLRERRYNSALLLDADGLQQGRYDKMHLVPFGEYVPFRQSLPWLDVFAPYDYDYSLSPGRKYTRFRLGDLRFGAIICYEDTDPSLARQYAVAHADGPAVDFIVNISNDGWFHGTSEHEQHLAICRFRAVECRRSVARAVNMGISAVIDGNGRITALPGKDWAGSKTISAVLDAKVPLDRRFSVYAFAGDWLAWSCAALSVAGMLFSFMRPALAHAPSTRCVE